MSFMDVLGGAVAGAGVGSAGRGLSYTMQGARAGQKASAASRRLGGGGGISSGYGGSYSAPAGPPPAGPGPIPSIDDFLNSDAGYKGQIADLDNSLSQFLADVTRRRGVLDTDYQTSQKALADQRVQDLANLENDYGARGILRSGLYGKAVGDYQNEYDQRQSDLTRRENDALAQLDQEQSRFQSQQDLQKQAAREDAIRRRAAQYGI